MWFHVETIVGISPKPTIDFRCGANLWGWILWHLQGFIAHIVVMSQDMKKFRRSSLWCGFYSVIEISCIETIYQEYTQMRINMRFVYRNFASSSLSPPPSSSFITIPTFLTLSFPMRPSKFYLEAFKISCLRYRRRNMWRNFSSFWLIISSKCLAVWALFKLYSDFNLSSPMPKFIDKVLLECLS